MRTGGEGDGHRFPVEPHAERIVRVRSGVEGGVLGASLSEDAVLLIAEATEGVMRKVDVVAAAALDIACEAKGTLVAASVVLGTGTSGEQAHALATVAQGQHEEARAAVLASLGVAHHGPRAVVHLRPVAQRQLQDRPQPPGRRMGIPVAIR